MTTQKEWQQEVFNIYKRIKRHKKPYDIKLENVVLTVLPNVFSPKYFTDSFWFAKELKEIIGRFSLLEIGTGTGIIALFCALNGAKVVATDINPAAVKNAKINFKRYNLNIPTMVGDLYEPIKDNQKFDFIFWNHPFHYWEEEVKEMLLKAGYDKHYNSLKRYVKEAGNYLTNKGRLLLGTGNFADLKKIKEIAKDNNYSLVLLKKALLPVSEGRNIKKGGDIKNEYRIYEFVPLRKIK